MAERLSLRRSSVRKSILAYPLASVTAMFVCGVLFWGGFNWSLELANTEEFCISCHVMRSNVFVEYKKTIHYSNRTGVRATCPDCHVPKEWRHKVIRKIGASNELLHWFIGTIDTREKFEARRLKLANYVWSAMKKTNSQECRNCHGAAFMNLGAQKTQAGIFHELGVKWGETCIDCHKGVAHSLPDDYNTDAFIDTLHERAEKEKIGCKTCHKGMASAKDGDKWD